jgi:20S proteasome alpha/beta subunit
MTTLSALKGKGFVVIGADSQVTAGNLKYPFPYSKIQILGSNLISGSGSVGYLQRLLAIALRDIRINRVALDNLNLEPEFEELCKHLAELNFSLPLEHKHFNPFSFLIAGLKEGEAGLCSIGSDGSIIYIPSFFCEGSGSDFAISTLSKKYKPDISMTEAVNLCLESLSQATKHDCYTNNSPQVFALYLEKNKWKIQEYKKEIQEEIK